VGGPVGGSEGRKQRVAVAQSDPLARDGRFGRFGETEVAEAAREVAVAFAEKARPR
jgi:hypothetical protein